MFFIPSRKFYFNSLFPNIYIERTLFGTETVFNILQLSNPLSSLLI